MNNLSPALLAEMFGQVSDDPFITLVTISHPDFDTLFLANNTVDIVSRGLTFQAFPMSVKLPADNGEGRREVTLEFDNVSLELLDELRTVITPMDVKLEMALASAPDDIQLVLEELKLRSVSYDKQRVSAKLYMDSFLNVEVGSEKYSPERFPGLF